MNIINNMVFDYNRVSSALWMEPSLSILSDEFSQPVLNTLVSDAWTFQSNPVEFISSVESGAMSLPFQEGTFYTGHDNNKDSIIFGISQSNRLIDIEMELIRYENKYAMKSENFYENWKLKSEFDKSDFNKWADLYRLMRYAQE